eukprot:CAMPEP_0178951618 /NCGR_PEP_ID=MMETSP0789-20121207/7332_1 /TAXON_ID=3005 /ORGANISM="Rhizosolenia setigera, Strain CCMP 1694" /LENGTH=279 /DNA_ID=CAMNT_0020632523 /DNA_START=79 /DNA_END=918 /DNA_ORIENTATION=+
MMYRVFLLGVTGSLLLEPAVSQFGVSKKKRGTSFQEMEAAAAEVYENGGMDLGAFGDFGDMDPKELEELIQSAMNDPEMMEMMSQINNNVEGAMEELANLTPEQLTAQMEEAMKFISSEEYLQSVLGNKEDVLKNLAESGMVDAETLKEYEANPEKLEQDLKEAMTQMQELFSDPEALESATQMATQMADFMKDPDALANTMKEFSAQMQADLSDDDKIEEARLQLLSNPDLAGDPSLAHLFESEEMKEILKDPVKWRESVKQGQAMMFNGEDGAKAEM